MLSQMPDDSGAAFPLEITEVQPIDDPDPRKPIELVAGGSGTTDDPAGTDRTTPPSNP